ncbi:transposase [Leptolyngbya sp. PCC 6406]|uniref:transposase n=1 Tax=Leptolyngbya sp. PCC 6406 TaxID=1173264 RepID=UPI0021F0AEF1|nr:transposase [Leptolyngbya sp. PCC 6406]
MGKINDKSLHLNQHGLIVEKIWQEIPNHFPCISLDAAIVMPNHFHGILTILDNSISERSNHLSKTKNIREKRPRLGQVVAYFKYQSTKIININRDMIGVKLWQRSYYEHIIRSEASLNRLRQYILSNPEKWQLDQLHPENPSKW